MALRVRMFSSVHAAVGLASQRFVILPDASSLGTGTITYQLGSLNNHLSTRKVDFHVSEHHTVADLVQLMRSSSPFASLLDGLDYGDGFVLIGFGAQLELAPILSSFAWKTFTFHLIVYGPKLTPTSQVILHP